MFSPTDYNGIAQAMHRVTTDENLRKDMVLKGGERLEVFNWKRTSDALWNAVLKTVADGS
jgi:glycosyltransferase involved in cell wall biosynthesis